MTERSRYNILELSVGANFSGERSMFYRAYRALGFAYFSILSALPARSYFPAVSGQLLPRAVEENSRARACKSSLPSCETRNPVRAIERLRVNPLYWLPAAEIY
jgi:hypothetical protein